MPKKLLGQFAKNKIKLFWKIYKRCCSNKHQQSRFEVMFTKNEKILKH